MKITFDARLINSSGIGVYLQNILSSKALLNYQLTLLHHSKDQSYFQSFKNSAKLIPFNAELYSVKELIQAPFFTANTDVFWSPHYNVPLINFARKSVVTIHDVFHLAYYETLTPTQKIYAKLLINRAVKSDLIFTVSEFSKAEIVRLAKADPAKIKVIYNGVDFERFNRKTSAEETSKVLSDYQVSFPYILFVGNVKPHKNLKTALQAFKIFSEASPQNNQYYFLIVGKKEGFITGDNQIDALLKQPFYSSKVRFTGWVNQNHLPHLYQQASLFLFPSLYEGFGFPPLEAMAAGCPVISSYNACMPEIYEDAAIYFDPLQPHQIASCITQVLSNPDLKLQLLNKGLKQAKKFSWERSIIEKLKYINEFA